MRLFTLFALAAALCYAQRQDGSFERTVNVSGSPDVELITDAGGINVVPGNSGTVHIRAILRASDNWSRRGNVEDRIRDLEAHPPIVQTGNSIRVGGGDQARYRGISMRLE